MKWGTIGITGVIGLAVLGGLLWWAVQFDTSTESAFVVKYKKSFVESCVTSTEAKLVASGKILIDEMKSKVRDICTCGADVSAEEFTKLGDVSLAELTKLQNDPAFMEKVPRIMQACNMRSNAQ